MLFFGLTEEARNYSCRISIKNKFGNEFNYSGPVHTLNKSEKAIIDAKMVKENNLKIEVSIQNLKNVAVSTESQDLYQIDSDSECVYSDPTGLDSDSSLDSF